MLKLNIRYKNIVKYSRYKKKFDRKIYVRKFLKVKQKNLTFFQRLHVQFEKMFSENIAKFSYFKYYNRDFGKLKYNNLGLFNLREMSETQLLLKSKTGLPKEKKRILSINRTNFHIDLRSFYHFHILRLFSDYNFKFYFFKIMNNVEFKNAKIRSDFLRYEFFGSKYLKIKLLFLFKLKFFVYFFRKFLKVSAKRGVAFFLKVREVFFYLFSYLRHWLLMSFLNKYHNTRSNSFSKLQCYRKEIQKLFLLRFFFFDKNLDFLFKYSKKLRSWLFYKKKKQREKRKIFKLFFRALSLFQDKEQFFFGIVKNLNLLYFSIIFLNVSVKLNNVFVTVTNIFGKTLFKYSAGFFGNRGKKRRDPLILANVTSVLALKFKKYVRLNLVVKIKRKITNKYLKRVLDGLKKKKVFPLYFFFLVNRAISKRRLRKVRRL